MTRLWILALASLVAFAASACQTRDTAKPEARQAHSGGQPPTGDMPSMTGMAKAGDSSGVPIDRARAGRLGITFARAAARPLERRVRLTGTLAYAEPRREYVNARVNGWV